MWSLFLILKKLTYFCHHYSITRNTVFHSRLGNMSFMVNMELKLIANIIRQKTEMNETFLFL